MSLYILNIISSFGYFGMFIAMILEAVIIIIPSEVILATGGILAANNIFSFLGAFITGLLGSVFCAITIYLMGYYGGRPFIEKYGKYFFMKKEDIEKSDKWFSKYGMKAALFGRCLPIIRTFISLPIGIARLDFKKFVIYTTIGSIPWTLAFVSAGYFLGDNWEIVSSYIDILKLPITICIIIFIAIYIFRRILKNKIIYINTKGSN